MWRIDIVICCTIYLVSTCTIVYAENRLELVENTNISEQVFIRVNANKNKAIVNERITVTLLIYLSVSVKNVGISELVIGHKAIKFEHVSSYTEKIVNGVKYFVHEYKYFVVPDRKGKLIIPSITFLAELPGNKSVEKKSRPIVIFVI